LQDVAAFPAFPERLPAFGAGIVIKGCLGFISANRAFYNRHLSASFELKFNKPSNLKELGSNLRLFSPFSKGRARGFKKISPHPSLEKRGMQVDGIKLCCKILSLFEATALPRRFATPPPKGDI